MKIPHLFLIAVVASSGSVQPPGAPRDSSVVRRQLLDIEADISRANRECDYKYFNFIEADEFIFTDARGNRSTKKEDLAGEKDCRKNDAKQSLDEVIVQLHGDGAVLSARSTVAFTGRDGQPITRRSRFTDVFVWHGGRWQLVAGHSSLIP